MAVSWPVLGLSHWYLMAISWLSHGLPYGCLLASLMAIPWLCHGLPYGYLMAIEQVNPVVLHKIKAFSVQRLLFGMKILMGLHKHCTIPRAKYLLSSESPIESTATWRSQSQTCLDTGPNSAALCLIPSEQWSECAYAFQYSRCAVMAASNSITFLDASLST